MTKQEKINWVISKHENTNHMYDTYLPYKFHLIMVVEAFKKFKYLLEDNIEGDIDSILEDIELSAWGHDTIEDTRTSYNDVKQALGQIAADIIYALTNEKGKNRAERANDKYYEGIRMTPFAVFVKLCDRIANVQYSKMTGSSMFEKYKKENPHFIVQLGWDDYKQHPYEKMFAYLNNLFINE